VKKVLVVTGALLLLAVVVAACTAAPAAEPTTAEPTAAPTAQPTLEPTAAPTAEPTAVPATQVPTTTPSLLADAIRGGKLYDNWMKELGVDVPAGDQPLWATQSSNTRTGGDTWRCKECHGWDYKGLDGAYGSGSHRTGFKGILGATSLPAEELSARLDGTANPAHNFSTYFTADATNQVAAFIQQGLVDMSAFINADKTVVGGDLVHGKTLFDDTCQACHGADGKTLNFGDDAAPEYLGTIAVDNPWEFFHKASFGQPGTPNMPATLGLGWTQQDIIDVLTYAQTLPSE
jgi:thiosulfate dehydrogenase